MGIEEDDYEDSGVDIADLERRVGVLEGDAPAGDVLEKANTVARNLDALGMRVGAIERALHKAGIKIGGD